VTNRAESYADGIAMADEPPPLKPNMKKILFCTSLLLGSAGMAFLSACSSTGEHRSTGAFIDDSAITAKVKGAFVQDDVVKAMDVKVDTYNGNVQLSGFVENSAQRTRAEQIARDIAGVHDVTNNIQLSPPAR
jgi:osmotically-inducible protein OsmY